MHASLTITIKFPSSALKVEGVFVLHYGRNYAQSLKALTKVIRALELPETRDYYE